MGQFLRWVQISIRQRSASLLTHAPQQTTSAVAILHFAHLVGASRESKWRSDCERCPADAGIIRSDFFKVFDSLNSTLTHSQLRNAMGASILEIAARRALILAYPTRARGFEHAWLSVLRQSDCIQRAQASCGDASCHGWSTRRSTRHPDGAVLSDLSDDPSIVEPIELATDAALGRQRAI